MFTTEIKLIAEDNILDILKPFCCFFAKNYLRKCLNSDIECEGHLQ